MDFRLLGPLQVESDGRDVTPTGRKQRVLLAVLLLRANELVPADDLIDALWGSEPPATAQTALHGHVSALRRALGAHAIETRAGGYVLRADTGSIDLHRFTFLVETARQEADAARRAGLLRSALGLVRGEPLPDLRYESFVRDHLDRLEALRLTVLRERVEADLGAGRHHEVIPELQSLVAENPYDESLLGALMLALYRSGRQADALQVLARGRRRLVDDLGIEPGPAVQELELAILNHDASLAAPLRRPRSAAPDLPRPAGPLIGRETERREIRERVGAEDGRLLTVTGPAGAGKTRLALDVAWTLRDDIADGAWFIPLAPIADPELVVPAIADALGIDTRGAPRVEDALQHALADRAALLVIDNLEHLLQAAPAIARLVAQAPRLRVLATSREPLRVAGERVHALGPLAVPAAMELFAERARALDPRFALTDANAAAVEEICRRLDGLPLAIELAAARITLFAPAALVSHLRDRLRLLTSGERDVAERHRTLRAAIDWSHALLTAREQALFARLSVFAGSWTLEAADAVCGPADDLIDVVGSLVDKSLLQRSGSDEEPRFAMLETIREYARERLDEEGATPTQRAHAEFFVTLAEALEPLLVGRRAAETQRRLVAELDDCRAALRWCIDHGEGALALRLIAALWRFWWDRGLAAESRSWADGALAVAADAPPGLRGRASFVASDAYYASGRLDEYRGAVREASRLLRAGSDDAYRLYALWALAVIDHLSAHPERARRIACVALQRAEAGGHHDLVGRLEVLLGLIALSGGDERTAVVRFDRAVAVHSAIEDAYGRAVALQNLALAALAVGDLQRARYALAGSLDAWDFSSNLHNLGHELVTAAGIFQAVGQAPLATRVVSAVRASFDAVGIALQPAEAAIEERVLAEADRTLGSATFASERARGAQLAPADLLPEVMAALADPVGGPPLAAPQTAARSGARADERDMPQPG